MNPELIYVFVASLVAVLVGATVVAAGLRRSAAPAGSDAEKLRTLEAELVQLRDGKADAERRLAAEERTAARIPILELELKDRSTQLDVLKEAKAEIERDLATAREALTQTTKSSAESLVTIEKQIADLQERLRTEQAAHETARKEAAERATKLASAEERLEQEMKQATEKLKLLSEARDSMTNEFKLLAESVMTRHGEAFTKLNKEQVEGVLNPLREKLAEFQQGLQLAHTETAKDRATLAEQIRQLTETSGKMTSETQNLTRALKGKAQTQGAWGEMILSTILERSGLREGDEYVKQQSHAGEEGARLRPDVIVNLPGGQRVVIDAKVSLTAFEAYVNAASDVERSASLIRHLQSLKMHIKTLSRKEYHSAVGNELDYVIMFVPIEGALAVALQEDPGMTVLAAESNVAIATPTTLMMALRTIANVWQVERRNRNAEVIAERAGKIYDKFVGFLEDMDDLGARLDRARESFDGAVGKLSTGRGNIVKQVEQLKLLGASTSKAIPTEFLSDLSQDEPTPAEVALA